ncbi:MAG TPA: GTPase [Phycisphaerales bacterium]|nr:GTPase [Phycisphaerales bacterium]
MDAWCRVSSGGRVGPGGRTGAIACIDLIGDIDGAFLKLDIRPVPPGQVRLRRVPAGAVRDEAVVGRWSDDRATLMIHGGRAVVTGVLASCQGAGIRHADALPHAVEAVDEIESLMLRALARAHSPAAVDLLLDQPRRWRHRPRRTGAEATAPGAVRDAALHRLIEPALVVAVGPPNIGKSSLLNALAGRGVAVVADEPGTTRDHVGALIDLTGVVVRWVDTPGLESGVASDPIQAESQRLARETTASADVLLLCSDARHALREPPPTSGVTLRIGLRADLGPVVGAQAEVSVLKGTGVEDVVAAVREAVVPRRYLDDGLPWAFWSRGQGSD